MKEIPLTQGKVAIVDDEDFDWLNKWKWFAHYNGWHWYAIRMLNRRTLQMHRVILNPPEGYQCDHINRDGLDNRRVNLRICTNSQNQHNCISRMGTSKYKGISWKTQANMWYTHITLNGNYIFLGYFKSETDAAKAYNKAATKYYGDFARLNVIKES